MVTKGSNRELSPIEIVSGIVGRMNHRKKYITVFKIKKLCRYFNKTVEEKNVEYF